MARGGYEAVHTRRLDAEGALIPLALGFLFGFVTVKGTAYLPTVITGFLQWKVFLLLKFYLAALAASLIGASILSMAGSSAARRFEASRITIGPGFVSIALGAVLSGLGMALTGCEPAAAFTQTGSGIISGLYVLCGGMLAVLVYGFFYREVFSKVDEQARPAKSSLDDLFRAPYWQVALPLGIAVAGFCWLMEAKLTQPWTSELPSGTSADKNPWLPHLTTSAWNIYLVGAIVGLLQIPLRASLYCLLDTTDAFISAVTVPLRTICDMTGSRLPDWFNRHGYSGRLWGLFFFGAAAGGACLSAWLGDMLAHESGYGIKWCLAGGFCLVMGALICGSCPTGLIVSGCSDLNLQAMLGATIVLSSAIGFGQMLSDVFDVHPEQSSAALISF